MISYHGSIYQILEGSKVFLEYAQLHIDGKTQYIEIVSEKLHDQEWEILLGEFNDFDHREVTFIKCRTGGYSGGVTYKYKISFEVGFAGCHFRDINDIRTTEARFYLPPFTEWLIDSDLKGNLHHDYGNKIFEVPQEIEVSISKIEDLEVIVRIVYPFSSSGDKFEIERSSLVIFKSDADQPFDYFINNVNKFKKLFFLFSNINPEPSTLSFKDIEMGMEKTSLGWFKIVGEHVEPKNVKFRDTPEIRFRNLRNQFSKLVETFYKEDDLATVVDLILERRYNVDLAWKSYFLNLVVAIESFTDITKPKTNFPSLKTRLQKRDEISELIEDTELRIWFRENTKYLKKPETRDKILIYSDSIEYLMGVTFEFDVDVMISKMKKTRDLIAHTGKYDKVFSPLELFMAGKILEFTLRAELFKIILPESKKIVDDFLEEGKRRIKYLATANKYKGQK